MKGNEPNISPNECAKAMIADIQLAFGCPFVKVAELSFVRLLISCHPGIETINPGPTEIHYQVKHDVAQSLAVAVHGNRETLEMVLHICEANIWNGKPVPQPFRALCMRRIHGDRVGAKGHGKVPGKDFGRFFSAFVIGRYLRDAFNGLPLVHGDGDEPYSAADFVQEAFKDNNVNVKYTLVRDWLTHPKHEANRWRALAIENRLKEALLYQIGVLKHERQWIIGPYGPFGPIGKLGRMT